MKTTTLLFAAVAIHCAAVSAQGLPAWLNKSQSILRQAQQEPAEDDDTETPPDATNVPALLKDFKGFQPRTDDQTKEMAAAIAERAKQIHYLATEKRLSADEIVKEMKAVRGVPKTVRQEPATQDEQLAANWNTDAAYIFISQSMPVAEIKAAFQMSVDTGAIIVLRGVRKDQSVDDLMYFMHEHIADKDHPPIVAINPAVFKEFGVESAPVTIVRHNGKTVRTKGIIDIDYLLNQIVEGKREGELAPVGPSYELAEEDILLEIKRRIEAIDWEKEKQGAVDRMWTNGHWKPIPLPTQEKSTIRQYDPTVVYNEDVIGSDNQVVIRAGTRINPLDHVPLQGHIIVFDGTDKKQMAQVKKWMKDHPKVMNFMLIANNMEVEKAMAGWIEMSNYFGQPVTLANSYLLQRFDVRAVPFIAYSTGNKLTIHELGSKD